MADTFTGLDAFIARHQLSGAFAQTANDCFVPLAKWLERRRAEAAKPGFVLGISGAQGTGKSTLSAFLADFLGAQRGCNVVELSIDDLYLTPDQRQVLARDTHPLLATRGVPGTHDVALGCTLIDQLRTLQPTRSLALPRFDKTQDDRHAPSDWPLARGPVDLIVLEGWCVGSVARPQAELMMPINALEEREDPDGVWRRFVNTQLATVYPPLFKRIDALVYLAAPDFDSVRRWRMEQEVRRRDVSADSTPGVMSEQQIVRFVAHFERVTRSNALDLPHRADVVIRLRTDHRASEIVFKS